jgi:enoyl-[acyl-carrier protein] reductase I
MNVNLKAPFELMRLCLPHLQKSSNASVINISSVGGISPEPGLGIYSVSKAALISMTKAFAKEWGDFNIRVNAISAGPIKTLAASGIGDFRYILKWNEYNAPLRRTVTIEEVGDTAAFLLSDMSKGMTGEILHVDAGYHVVGMKNPSAPDISVGKD